MPSLFASYLRVYEPLTAFDRDRQVFWRQYAREGRDLGPIEGPVRQRTAVLEALGAGWTRLPDLPDEAYVLEWDNSILVCPWNLRLRVAEAALNARDGVPAVLADAFVPPVLAGQAKAVVEDWRSGAKVLEQGVPRVHEQIATWGVPLRWFAFVDLEEREISLSGRRRTLRYRTEISKARRRAHRAVSVLRKALGDAPITEAVEEGTRWLEEFHPVRWWSSTTAASSTSSRRTTSRRTIPPDWWRPDSRHFLAVTLSQPVRRTRSWSRGGVWSSFWSDATDLRK